MPSVTQPLRDEHRQLFPHVEKLRTAGDAVGAVPPDTLLRHVDEAHEFLAHHLIPHATAEDRALYPVVGKVLGAPETTATMSRDHIEVAALTEELANARARIAGGTVSDADAHTLRRLLYGLYALVKVHFAKEEEVYLPILDARLSEPEARAMFEAMERAAESAKHKIT